MFSEWRVPATFGTIPPVFKWTASWEWIVLDRTRPSLVTTPTAVSSQLVSTPRIAKLFEVDRHLDTERRLLAKSITGHNIYIQTSDIFSCIFNANCTSFIRVKIPM
jgi:hypothetical protein